MARDALTDSQIRQKTLEVLGRRPCDWQIRAVRAGLEDKDIIMVSPTGSGKTLTFWIPLLFKMGIMIVVSPLIILGEENVKELESMRINAIGISAETATSENFRVRLFL